MNNMDKQALMAYVENILMEQLKELGEDPSSINPHEYVEHMKCNVYHDSSMVYYWKEMPILRMVMEKHEEGTVYWRFFTGEGKDSGSHVQ